MASLRKLSPAEILEAEQRPLGVRAQVAQEYDAYVAGFAVGDQGRVEMAAGERRTLVRSRLQAAARRQGLALRFRPGPGEALFFRVEAAPPEVARPATPATPAVEQQGSAEARRKPAPPQPRRRPTATERYRDVLPRWMRDGPQTDRRDGRKRRVR